MMNFYFREKFRTKGELIINVEESKWELNWFNVDYL